MGGCPPFGPDKLVQKLWALLPGTPLVSGRNLASVLSLRLCSLRWKHLQAPRVAQERGPGGETVTVASVPGAVLLGSQIRQVLTLRSPPKGGSSFLMGVGTPGNTAGGWSVQRADRASPARPQVWSPDAGDPASVPASHTRFPLSKQPHWGRCVWVRMGYTVKEKKTFLYFSLQIAP